MENQRIRVIVMVLAAVVASGCATSLPQLHLPADGAGQDDQQAIRDAYLQTHVVMFNKRGTPIDPTGNVNCTSRKPPCYGEHGPFHGYPELIDAEYDAYLSRLIAGIREDPKQRKKVLLYFHGGMNTQKGSLARVIHQANVRRDSETDSASEYYVVYVNWQSSLFTSYWDHLAHVRQGHWRSGLRGYALVAPYLVADLVRAIGRAPVTWYYQLRNLFSSSSVNQTRWQRNSDLLFRTYSQNERNCRDSGGADENACMTAFKISKGGDSRTKKEKFKYVVRWGLTAPLKALVAPAIDALGKGSWDAMFRRTHNLFHPDSELRAPEFGSPAPMQSGDYAKGTGGLSRFLGALVEASEEEGWEIAVVGHSMGAIITNQVIRKFGEELGIKDIVYMAAACSLDDYQKTVFPYLEEHPEARMHHLTLHDRAEARDNPAMDLAPRGSLLVWIDSYLSTPRFPLERTAGDFNNLVQALANTPQEIRDRVSVKAFAVGARSQSLSGAPQKHGEFSDFIPGSQESWAFWVADNWDPAPE